MSPDPCDPPFRAESATPRFTYARRTFAVHSVVTGAHAWRGQRTQRVTAGGMYGVGARPPGCGRGAVVVVGIPERFWTCTHLQGRAWICIALRLPCDNGTSGYHM